MSSANHPASSRAIAAAFTLIELLVVISIIALLVSILVPTLGNAKWLARVASCAQNMHNVGQSASQYSSSYQMDTPWIFFDGTQDGPNESDYSSVYGRVKWVAGAGATPGNPAEALMHPDAKAPSGKMVNFEQFADDPAVFFCPASNKTAAVDYNVYGGQVFDTQIWGTSRYKYPHLAHQDDPFDSTSPQSTGRMTHTNGRDYVGTQSHDLMMHDAEQSTIVTTTVQLLWEHYNGLLVGGGVQRLADTVSELNTYLYGPTHSFYY